MQLLASWLRLLIADVRLRVMGGLPGLVARRVVVVVPQVR